MSHAITSGITRLAKPMQTFFRGPIQPMSEDDAVFWKGRLRAAQEARERRSARGGGGGHD